MNGTILLVDDDPLVRDILRIALRRAGYATAEAADGLAALRLARSEAHELIVLDIGLPEMDGLEVCRQLRRFSDRPVLFLSAREDEIDRVLGLELGADDYVTKPFSPRELVARVKAILKRSSPAGAPGPDGRLARGDLELLPDTHQCRFRQAPVTLTATELALLKRLMQRPDHVTSRVQLTDALYGTNAHASDRTTESHLRNLRRKLADAGCADAIETLHGIGVRMGPCHGA
jgi:two-component system, OmpR family, response regulator